MKGKSGCVTVKLGCLSNKTLIYLTGRRREKSPQGCGLGLIKSSMKPEK